MSRVEVRCPTLMRGGSRCGRLLLYVSSTGTGQLFCKCPRCREESVQWSSEVGQRPRW